ncbi:hypothetical protein FIU97_12000 [Roseivivax sp. THAF40]|uniref:S8 family serine peptidase n=1 Tax=unclassified Roseivivax TaxID=2639302 RepID=UPI001268ACD9|nr:MULTISPECIES: hypothetical protein [unclassified Roseivivax]QFS83555.1 hypothetical protein FIV09_12010 [Roseivivax sp. THAF197b]QFT47300.1 hypothetical protein FIU97_12000 [Roseivivax sp. THAF40]
MAKWTPNPQPDAGDIIDHITYFRLSRAEHHFSKTPSLVWWSVLVELADISIDAFQSRLSGFADDLVIPAAYSLEDRRRILPRQPVTIFARTALVAHLNDRSHDLGVTAVLLGASTPERFLDREARPQDWPDITVPEGTVVQAVVDDGIAIAHDMFRRGATESRIAYAHIFDAEPRPFGHTSLGRGLERGDIDALLRDCTFDGMLDEDLFYARSGQVDPARQVFSSVALRRSHGTHVMALAAGAERAQGPERQPIICASLPSRIVGDTTGLDMVPILYLAFHILVKQARRFRTETGAYAPVIFNFSYGNTGGPHDGTGLFATMFDHYFGAEAMDDAGQCQTAWLTLPAGNANLERLHAVVAVDAAETVILDLCVQPDDRTPSHVQIWLPVSAGDAPPDMARIAVRTPDGAAVEIAAEPGQHAELVNDQGAAIAWLAYQYVGGQTGRGLVTLSSNPTAHLEETSDLAPAGLWTLEITRTANAPPEPIHVWIRRDETLPGQEPGGRQSFFNNPDYVRFDRFGAPLPVDPPDASCPVRRSGTLSGFACGAMPVVVAAYVAEEAVLSDYSAAGPLNPVPGGRAPEREGPDLAARGDDSFVLRGVLSAGSRSGSWVRLAGTSVAAPQVARLAHRDIAHWEGTARDWAKAVAKREGVPLRDHPARTRVGAGAVKSPPLDR